ncbi:NAD(P)-binding protein [Westerdykella ornata]|uniref:NAD(P)-binding protein n=1 Tax=Westerdykella ornata TaxID=318751 RepID=A0A6A6JP03_WESOR|nr:NAD(P)-binding protein [Westerdykella ornata]KAF2278351.1 NAD(P)-binding protein [Westerdykella ornata]
MSPPTPTTTTDTTKPIALITGATRGIGLALARTLATNHSYHILLGTRTTSSSPATTTTAELLTTLRSSNPSLPLSIDPLPLDLTCDASIRAAAAAVLAKHGRLDLLVNNAGIALDHYPIEEGEPTRDAFRKTFDTNVFGTAAVTDAFIPLLSRAQEWNAKHHLPGGGGVRRPPTIVFISSTLGSITARVDPAGPYAETDMHIYRASKAAVNMLAAHYASRFRDQGWKVNAVCPGYVKTDMNGGEGEITVEEAMPHIVRVCTLGEDGETGTFTGRDGKLEW